MNDALLDSLLMILFGELEISPSQDQLEIMKQTILSVYDQGHKDGYIEGFNTGWLANAYLHPQRTLGT